MTYDELLKQQEKQREKFNETRFGDLFKLSDRQKAAPDPASFNLARKQLDDLYKAKDAELTAQHEKERKDFLRVKEPDQGLKIDNQKQEKDITDKAAELLERHRRRQQEQKERGIEPEL